MSGGETAPGREGGERQSDEYSDAARGRTLSPPCGLGQGFLCRPTLSFLPYNSRDLDQIFVHDCVSMSLAPPLSSSVT